MNSLESFAMDWAARGWLALLAFTVAVLVVAALRQPCRRAFGAERAFQLWLLPPLAVLASQLPHLAATTAALPPLVYSITTAVGATASQANAAGRVDWRILALLLWFVGLAVAFAAAVAAQRRYRARLRGATPLAGALAHRPVLLAAAADVGPALVGAWRSRIVLPADFRERYDAGEQALILAHESAHAQRGDGWWCLLAQTLAALFWFHPFAWWALAALRHDQELACDAAVLRDHGAQRRRYANAMLKTQSAALALPVGCSWSPRHPLTERIAMLKEKPVSVMRRRASGGVLAVLICGVTGVAYAATSPMVATHRDSASTPDHYALDLNVSFDGNAASQHFSLCLKAGKYGHVGHIKDGDTDEPSWHGRIAALPADKGLIEVRADISGGTLGEKVRPIVRVVPGQQGVIEIGNRTDGEPGNFKGIKLVVTAYPGC